jgi:hypothetical protein
MRRGYVDPWATEKMSRSDAQRRYFNLVQYQIRPMLMDRRMSDTDRINVMKRVTRDAHRFKYESGVTAQTGTREEMVDLMSDMLKPEAPYGEECQDWVKRTLHAFGVSIEAGD